jgi:hypothetical protein
MKQVTGRLAIIASFLAAGNAALHVNRSNKPVSVFSTEMGKASGGTVLQVGLDGSVVFSYTRQRSDTSRCLISIS